MQLPGGYTDDEAADGAAPSGPRPGFRDLSFFTCGTSRLGDPQLLLGDRLALARRILSSGIWMQISDGKAINVIESAVAGGAPLTRNVMVRITWLTPQQFVHQQISLVLRPLRLASMPICQLAMGDLVAEQFAGGGDAAETLRRLKLRGIVQRIALEITLANSPHILQALRGGHCENLIDGYVVNLNPLERSVSQELWEELLARQAAIVALNGVSPEPATVSGAAPSPEGERASQAMAIFKNSGCQSWTQFCFAFARAIPQVRSVVAPVGTIAAFDARLNEAGDGGQLTESLRDQLLNLA